MENATALLLTNYYVKTEGEKPVYLYQPMTGVIDVEGAIPVYLRAEAVSKPKQLWYTGLSRTEKYPLLEVLDEKKSYRIDWSLKRRSVSILQGIRGWHWRWHQMQ